jgi:hypothetical protein
VSLTVPRRSIVRVPARDRHTRLICAECGQLVEQDEDAHTVRRPEVTRHHDHTDQLRVYGWVCTGHEYDLVMPRTYYEEPDPDDGCPVEVVYADRIARWVMSPGP